MTQQEFTSRTGVQVTNEEFWAINEQYNESDLNKDEFCKLWKKVNVKRVKDAESVQKKEESLDFLYDILMFNIGLKWYIIADDSIRKYTNAAERKRLESFGVKTKDELENPLTVYEVWDAIRSKIEELKAA